MFARFKCWRRRCWFARQLAAKRRVREGMNNLFDLGYHVGRFSMSRLEGKFQWYVAVRTGKRLVRWKIVATPSTMRIGFHFMRNVDQIAAESGKFNRSA